MEIPSGCPFHKPKLLSAEDLDARIPAGPAVVRAVDYAGRVHVGVGRAELTSGSRFVDGAVVVDHGVALSGCQPDLALRLLADGEVLLAGAVALPGRGGFVGITDIAPLDDVIMGTAAASKRLPIAGRAREIKSYVQGDAELPRWPESLGPLMARIAEDRSVVPEERSSAMPEVGRDVPDALKVEQNAHIAVIAEPLYAALQPALTQTWASFHDELTQNPQLLLDDARCASFLRGLSEQVRTKGAAFMGSLAASDPAQSRLRAVYDQLMMIDEARRLLEGTSPRLHFQTIGGAQFGVDSTINAIRMAAVKLQERTGSTPTLKEVFDVFMSSKRLLRMMAAAHLESVRIRFSIDDANGLWAPERFQLVEDGDRLRIEFTPEAKAQLVAEHNLWFDDLVDGTTGCPATVSLGSGPSVVNRTLEDVGLGTLFPAASTPEA